MNEELYNEIDSEDDMSDEEKREAYFSQEADNEAEQEWQDQH